jgi:hypothetical protein
MGPLHDCAAYLVAQMEYSLAPNDDVGILQQPLGLV